MNVLIINAGSSSLKYQLMDPETGAVSAKGLCERIYIDGRLTHNANGKKIVKDIPMPTHSEAIQAVLAILVDPVDGVIKSTDEIDAVGHRVLHGGMEFFDSCIINDEVIAAIEKCIPLGPLHNPANLMGIRACQAVMPKTPQVAVFDTAFHMTMPPKAYRYAIPTEYYENDSIRRYGFHGTSHKYVTKRAIELMGRKDIKLVNCHLGNGSSLSAIKDGKCMDTSMGLTPLEGVVMGTRSGDMDPAIVKFIMEKRKERKFSMLFNTMLFIGFIALNIASSSVTIRVEMRWIYVSLAGALLFLSYIYGELTEGVKKELYLKRLYPWGILFALYVLLMLPAELFYRSCYPKLYLWPDQLRYNSLAEQTYEKYGDSIFGKTIYIMGNTYQMSDFTARTFFKVFDPKMKAEGTKVEFIDSIRDIGQVDDQMLVLREDPAHNAFQDITDFVRSLKLQIDYGYYSDGWMDEHASLTVMAGSTGEIELEFMYPGVMSGGEAISITKDEEPVRTLPLHSSVVETTLQAEPWQMVHLQFDYNFYMQNAREQRGQDRLAAIVHITTP